MYVAAIEDTQTCFQEQLKSQQPAASSHLQRMQMQETDRHKLSHGNLQVGPTCKNWHSRQARTSQHSTEKRCI